MKVILVTRLFIFLTLLSLCTSCRSPSNNDAPEVSAPHVPRSIDFRYTDKVQIGVDQGFQFISLEIQSNDVVKYYLVPKGTEPPQQESVIFTPVDNLALFSVSFIGYLDVLKALDRIKYVENIHFVYNEYVRKGLETGAISESGSFQNLNLEKFILDAPEVILLNDYLQEDDRVKKLNQAGIITIPLMEWKESHPLARAEWIKVFGALTQQEELADSIFDQIEQDYNEVTQLCAQDTNKTKAIFSSLYQGVWYMPGGDSYVAHILSDANGIYNWQHIEESGSLALSFEEVVLKSLQNDVWINPEANSLGELYARDGRYKMIGEKLTIGAYQSNARMSPNGGNDYWESGVVRPDLILRDYGKMLHPEKFQADEFYYFKKLN